MKKIQLRLILAVLTVLLQTTVILTGVTLKAKDTAPEKETDRLPYTIVDTGQNRCFENGPEIEYPKPSDAFYGQDAQYQTNAPAYRDNGDGTVTDLNTGLMWQKTPDFVIRTASEAAEYADKLKLAGYDDWRVPTIKELFSIADFKGNLHTQTPYIDTRYFDFQYPDTDQDRRIMDAQYRSSTKYLGTTMRHDKDTIFGFNFADGRIKGYPANGPAAGRQYIRCVRGQTYGVNDFKDNGDGTVTDHATGLMWMKMDCGKKMSWEEALKYAENLSYAGYDDWRLPDVKELQSIVDYTRAPDARIPSKSGPAIHPVFQLTETESWCWTGTTHIENGGAYYVCFGQAFSARKQAGKQINAHGAGAVRSDPKTGDPADYPNGKGPQGDEIRIYNYVRCVRGGNAEIQPKGPELDPNLNPGPQQMRELQAPPLNPMNQEHHSKEQHNNNRPPMGTEEISNHARHFINRLDKNNDGKVSKTEFDGPQDHFDKMDRNKDGFIDLNETPKQPPSHRRHRNSSHSGGFNHR